MEKNELKAIVHENTLTSNTMSLAVDQVEGSIKKLGDLFFKSVKNLNKEDKITQNQAKSLKIQIEGFQGKLNNLRSKRDHEYGKLHAEW